MADEKTIGKGQSAEDIRREIARTRSEMDQTVDAIGERLSPGRLVDEVWQHVRSGEDLPALRDVIREHPVPVALMGLGLGWLAIERMTGGMTKGHRDHVHGGTYERAEGRKGPFGPDAVNHDDPEWVHASTLTKVKAKVSEVGEHVGSAAEKTGELKEKAGELTGELKERAGELKERAGELTHEMKDRSHLAAAAMSDRAHLVADSTRQHLTQAREGASRFMTNMPLAAGAVAFGLGLAGGLAGRTTSVENKLVGEKADELKDEARRKADELKMEARHTLEEKAENALEVADKVAETVRQEVGVGATSSTGVKDSAEHPLMEERSPTGE
jgi:hypothetical protein